MKSGIFDITIDIGMLEKLPATVGVIFACLIFALQNHDLE